MKRTPLRRKNPMKRTANTIKRTRINRESKKHRERREETRDWRREHVESFGECMICGTNPMKRRNAAGGRNRLCVHEITNGALRQKSLDVGGCCLVLCWACNQDEVEDRSRWPRERQLALLMKRSPDHYDLDEFNEVFAPRRIEQSDVDQWLVSV